MQKKTGTNRAMLAALDLLGRRWVLRILWELREGAVGFRGLQERCGGVSPTMISKRLDELREARLIDEENALTALGRDLVNALDPVQGWAKRWAR
jgi:DNA-binding HxlR family transcriptional regulator